MACVGDSITYGFGVGNWPKNNYPAVLGRNLGQEYRVENFGVSGACVQSSSDLPYSGLKAYRNSLDFNADILIFMLGSNDSKPQNWKGADAFREAYSSLVNSYLQGEKQPKIYLCTPATAFFRNGKKQGITNYGIQPLFVQEAVQVVEETARERGYPVIDIHALTAENPHWFAADNVHPNADGAAAIAQHIMENITQ